MSEYFKYKHVNGIKFKSFKKLWGKAWHDKRKNLNLVYENTKPNEDKFFVWTCSLSANSDHCALLLEKRLNPKTNVTDKRRFIKLLKQQTYVLSPTISVNRAIEDMGFEIDYENHEDETINFRNRPHTYPHTYEEVEKPEIKIPESQWIRARDYQ